MQVMGKMLPQVKLESMTGNGAGQVDLPQSVLGKWTILYFYPKDDTPGCTKQACGYQKALSEFESLGVQVWGVSLDDLQSHQAFAAKLSLSFPLLADTEHVLSDALGVYGEQEWKGQKFMGLSRDTFIIDPEGKVAHEWRGVDPISTISETLEAVKRLQTQ